MTPEDLAKPPVSLDALRDQKKIADALLNRIETDMRAGFDLADRKAQAIEARNRIIRMKDVYYANDSW